MPTTETPARVTAIPLMLNCDSADVDQISTPAGMRTVVKLYAAGGLFMATIMLDRQAAKTISARIDELAGPALTPATLADLPRGPRP